MKLRWYEISQRFLSHWPDDDSVFSLFPQMTGYTSGYLLTEVFVLKNNVDRNFPSFVSRRQADTHEWNLLPSGRLGRDEHELMTNYGESRCSGFRTFLASHDATCASFWLFIADWGKLCGLQCVQSSWQQACCTCITSVWSSAEKCVW